MRLRGFAVQGKKLVIFTEKKFRLIGARARIKKLFHILVDLIPVFQTPADIETIPTYLGYLVKLNPETRHFKFSEDEIHRLQEFRQQLSQWDTEDRQLMRQPFSSQERHRVGRILVELRYVLADKIQEPLRETSFIILERDVPPPEPLVWPREIVIVLDHLRSPYNVGAILRTMECVGLSRVLSIGYTPRLDTRQVQRSAMGCDAVMEVEYAEDGVEAIETLKDQRYKMYALETIVPSTSVFDLPPVLQHDDNIALIVGNEECGVDEMLIARTDHLIHIPTFGRKNSLNVSIAFSITIYQFWQTLFEA